MQDPAIRKALAYAHQPRAVRPDRLRGPGRDGLRPDLAALQAVLSSTARTRRSATTTTRPRRKQVLKDGRLELLARRRARRTASRPSSSSRTLLRQATGSSRWPSARRPTRARSGSSIDLSFLSDDALNNRIYASGKTKDLYAPNYDAFLWDWDVSGTTPTPIMEVLLSSTTPRATRSTPARSSTRRCRRAHGGRDGGRHRRRGAEGRGGSSSATSPTCRSCISNAIERRPHATPGTAGCRSPAPDGGRSSRSPSRSSRSSRARRRSPARTGCGRPSRRRADAAG